MICNKTKPLRMRQLTRDILTLATVTLQCKENINYAMSKMSEENDSLERYGGGGEGGDARADVITRGSFRRVLALTKRYHSLSSPQKGIFSKVDSLYIESKLPTGEGKGERGEGRGIRLLQHPCPLREVRIGFSLNNFFGQS